MNQVHIEVYRTIEDTLDKARTRAVSKLEQSNIGDSDAAAAQATLKVTRHIASNLQTELGYKPSDLHF